MREFEQIIRYVNDELTLRETDQLWSRILANPVLLRLLKLVTASRAATGLALCRSFICNPG